MYVDLAYLPGSWSARTVDEEFFRRVRSLCYVVSGDDHLKEGVLRPLLDALLAGKHQWGVDIQVSDRHGGLQGWSWSFRSGRMSWVPLSDVEGVTKWPGCPFFVPGG